MERMSYPRLVVLPDERVDPARHVCRPIGGLRRAKDPGRPWVAVATGRTDDGFVLAERSAASRDFVARATANLAGCRHQWTVVAERGFLFWKRPDILRAYGEASAVDDFSSDLLLRADVMEAAATTLQSRALYAVIPKRGWLIVRAGEPGDLGRMIPLHEMADGIAGRAGRDAITRLLFFYDGPQLIGWNDHAAGVATLGVEEDSEPWG